MEVWQYLPEGWQILLLVTVILALSIASRSTLFGAKPQPAPPQSIALSWLPVGHSDNPFPYEVLDCRPVSLAMISTTKNPQIAATFAATRHLNAEEIEAHVPDDPVTIDCHLAVPCGCSLTDGPIFMAPAMEHKWDLYIRGGCVVARRSWTGSIVYMAEAEWLPSGVLNISRLQIARAVCASPDHALADFEFLLLTYVSRAAAAFPIPPNVARGDTQTIAFAGWSAHGRAALFAKELMSRPDERPASRPSPRS
jgi:hypothetical protein